MRRRNKIKQSDGFVLIFLYLILSILTIIGAAFFLRSTTELKLTERQRTSIQALSIAEAGLERALYELRLDFENDPTNPSWVDGDINGISCGPDTSNFYSIPFSSTSIGHGNYSVQLKNVAGESGQVWVRSMGSIENTSKTIQAYIKVEVQSPWGNAIFAGGSGESIINGDINIRGSVHLLGVGLSSSDLAINLSGSANIGNNYEGIPQLLKDKIPSCPTVMFNGEQVESLGAVLRIKQGKAGLSGAATVGSPNVSGNTYKETIDGVYVTDGFVGNQGEQSAYSDNGTQNAYDLGNSVQFPSLQDPYPGYATYQDYLKLNALVISDQTRLSQMANITPNSSFSYSDSNGSISLDGNGNLYIDGIVYIDGGDLKMLKQGSSKTITYSGKGSIFVTGEAEIKANLITPGENSFPTNIIGIMSPEEVEIEGSQINVMGVFYSEDKMEVEHQAKIAGSLMGNSFELEQVPDIYYVPAIVNNLPPGMIGSEIYWSVNVKVVSWQKI